MRYSDHFSVTEAWRKAEQFERDVERDRLLNLYRASRAGALRHRAARFLLRLTGQLEPSLRRDNGLPSPKRC